MTDVLLFGKNGQLGYELTSRLAPRFDVTSLSFAELDLRDAAAITATIRDLKPALILNAAAYTRVDKAESEAEQAHAVNAIAPGIMAEEARRLGCGMIHFSTDFVFDGGKASPYTEADTPRPLNVYGASKLAGEAAVAAAGADAIVFRTSWLYSLRGSNFLLTMVRLLTERETLGVVDDQTGSPTSVPELAAVVAGILPDDAAGLAALFSERRGLYHLSCRGQGTWFDFAGKIRDHLAANGRRVADLSPITTDEYPTPAMRPPYSVLDTAKFRETFGRDIAEWREALARILPALP